VRNKKPTIWDAVELIVGSSLGLLGFVVGTSPLWGLFLLLVIALGGC
jgi:hypothetical protein